MSASEASDDHYMLLVVRADGVAPVVDLLPADLGGSPRDRALALLAEHTSAEAVEVWRGGVLKELIVRG